MEKMNLFQNDNLSLQICLNQSRSNKIQERKKHMNNQFILPPIIFIFVKIQKYNKINIIKLYLSLKYILRLLFFWYFPSREKTKKIWVQSKGLNNLKLNQKKMKKVLTKFITSFKKSYHEIRYTKIYKFE